MDKRKRKELFETLKNAFFWLSMIAAFIYAYKTANFNLMSVFAVIWFFAYWIKCIALDRLAGDNK